MYVPSACYSSVMCLQWVLYQLFISLPCSLATLPISICHEFDIHLLSNGHGRATNLTPRCHVFTMSMSLICHVSAMSFPLCFINCHVLSQHWPFQFIMTLLLIWHQLAMRLLWTCHQLIMCSPWTCHQCFISLSCSLAILLMSICHKVVNNFASDWHGLAINFTLIYCGFAMCMPLICHVCGMVL